MPEKQRIERAREDAREGKSPRTQAGEFVREEMHHIREGKHGARSTKQAIAIGLSKARRAGVKLGVPKKGKASTQVRRKAERDLRRGTGARSVRQKPAPGQFLVFLKEKDIQRHPKRAFPDRIAALRQRAELLHAIDPL